MLAHVAHLLKVAVTDPDNPDYPGIPDGADGGRLDPVIPDLLPQAASSRSTHRGRRDSSRHFRYFRGKAMLPPRQEGPLPRAALPEAFPMFRGQPPQIDYLTALGA